MRVHTTLIALSLACVLTSCATAYQPDGIAGGYSDQRLDNNTAQVSFRGNRFNSSETLHSYLLRRCAEVTLHNGYNYFVLVGGEGNPGSGAKVNDEFSASTTIKMFKGNKPESDIHAYDAADVIRRIPVEEGEIAEALPPPPVSISSSQAASSPVAGVGESTSNAANATTVASSAARIPVVNPNALTNQPPPFEHF